MAAKNGGHICEKKLRHCHPIYGFRSQEAIQGKVTTQLICGENVFSMFMHGMFLITMVKE